MGKFKIPKVCKCEFVAEQTSQYKRHIESECIHKFQNNEYDIFLSYLLRNGALGVKLKINEHDEETSAKTTEESILTTENQFAPPKSKKDMEIEHLKK